MRKIDTNRLVQEIPARQHKKITQNSIGSSIRSLLLKFKEKLYHNYRMHGITQQFPGTRVLN